MQHHRTPSPVTVTPRRIDERDDLLFNQRIKAKGRFRVMVVQPKADGTEEVVGEVEQSNLILDSGLDHLGSGAAMWHDVLDYGVAGTGTTPTTDDLTASSFSQAGTTVTRDSGTDVFAAPDVGKLLRFNSGEERYITSYTSPTEVEVDTSGTVASSPVTLYRVDQTGLVGEVKRSNSYHSSGNTVTYDRVSSTTEGTATLVRTYNFTAESSDTVYTEVGVSWSASSGNNLFSRVLLAGSVTVLGPAGGNPGQQLRLEYTLTVTVPGGGSAFLPVTPTVTGWPWSYGVSSITSNGTSWTVTTDAAYHFENGDLVNLASTTPTTTAITAATSTGSDFTLTAAGHGKAVDDYITVEGVTPSGYNGDWRISGVAGDDITVTSTANPGTGTVFGTLRFATPSDTYAITVAASTGSDFTLTIPTHQLDAGDFFTVTGVTPTGYNGTWTVASTSGDDVVVTSAANPGAGTLFGVMYPAATATARTLTAATATATYLEYTTSGVHGFSVGEQVVAQGVDVATYNGQFVISAVPSTTTFRVTSTADPADASTFGEVTETPQQWFDGQWAISGVPSPTTFTISNPAQPPAAGAAGTVQSDLVAEYAIIGSGLGIQNYSASAANSVFQQYVLDPADRLFYNVDQETLSFFSGGPQTDPTAGWRLDASDGVSAVSGAVSYSNGDFYQDFTCVLDVATGNIDNMRWILVSRPSSNGGASTSSTFYWPGWAIHFDHVQKKDGDHTLSLTFRRTFGRDLS